MTPQEAARVVAYLAGAFPGTRLDPEKAASYAFWILDLDADEVEQAALELSRQPERFFPNVGELTDTVVRRRLALPTAGEAFEQVLGWQRWRQNQADQLPPMHPLVRRVLKTMGGVAGYVSSDRPDVWRSQFVRAYDAAARDEVRAASLASAGLPTSYEPGLRPLTAAAARLAAVTGRAAPRGLE